MTLQALEHSLARVQRAGRSRDCPAMSPGASPAGGAGILRPEEHHFEKAQGASQTLTEGHQPHIHSRQHEGTSHVTWYSNVSKQARVVNSVT